MITYGAISLILFGNAFYAYRCIFRTREYIDQYGFGDGSAGVIILRFPTDYTATVTGGVTSSSATVGTDTVLTITATSDSSQTVTFS